MPKNSKNEKSEKTTVEQCKETIELKIEKRRFRKQRRAEKLEQRGKFLAFSAFT